MNGGVKTGLSHYVEDKNPKLFHVKVIIIILLFIADVGGHRPHIDTRIVIAICLPSIAITIITITVTITALTVNVTVTTMTIIKVVCRAEGSQLCASVWSSPGQL